MTTYTSLTNDDLEAIARQFRIGSISSFTPLEGGSANTNLLATTANGKYVISIREDKEFEDVKLMTQLLKSLQQRNLPVETLVPTITGDNLTTFKGKPLYVKTYIEGSITYDLDYAALTIIGAMLAGINEVDPPAALRTTHRYGLESFSEVINCDSSIEFCQWLSVKHDFITANIPADLPRGLIHGDLFADNVIVRDGKPIAIIDFEETCSSHLIFDLGMAAVGACQQDGFVSLERFRYLVKGYQQIRNLTQQEVESLQLFVQYAAVATAFWRFRQFNIWHPGHEKANRYQGMVRIANQIHSIPQNEFINVVFSDNS